jgi:photosystem II stability/assembly factor-like uncharacterized protein
MSIRSSVFAALTVVLASLLLFCRAALADEAKEAGPEDGILCCNGLVPFLFNDDKVMTVTGRAGVFRSDDRGGRWRRSMDGLVAANGIAPFVGFACNSPSKPNIVYALGGAGPPLATFNGLFSSDNFGSNWTRRGEVNTGFGFNFCAVDADDPKTVYVSGFDDTDFTSRTWRSADGGKTVHEIGSLLPACAVGGALVTVPGAVYLRNFECVAVSTDGGKSFQLLPTPPGFVGAFDVSPDGRVIFLNSFDPSFQFVGTLRSTDGGATYVATTGLNFGFNRPLGFDATDASHIYAADGLRLHVSTDGGLTFSPLPNDPRFLGSLPLETVGVDSRGSVLVIGHAGPGPFRSDDGGQTYQPAIDGFRASAVQDLAFDADGKLLVGVLHTQVVFRQTGDDSFAPLGTALIDPNGVFGVTVDTASVVGSPVQPNVILAATSFSFGLVRTDNGGQSWAPATVTGDPDGFSNSRMRFATASRVYLVAPNQQAPGLYRSDDAGKNFALLSNLRFGAIAVDRANEDTIYVGTYTDNAGLFKSTDGGQTLQPLRSGDYSAITIDSRNPQVIYAGERLGQVIRSRDGGQTFVVASEGLAGAGVHGLAQDSAGTLYVWLRSGGLFSSNDGASTWKKVDTAEALARSGVEAGRGTLVADPQQPGVVYLGNAGVIRISD